METSTYRLLKKCVPGGYTFILKATNKVPKLMLKANKTTVGIRVPDHQIPHAISEVLAEPLLTTSLILPDQQEPLYDIEDVTDAMADQIDILIDGGYCGFEPTTVVDFTEMTPQILRQGCGDVSLFE